MAEAPNSYHLKGQIEPSSSAELKSLERSKPSEESRQSEVEEFDEQMLLSSSADEYESLHSDSSDGELNYSDCELNYRDC